MGKAMMAGFRLAVVAVAVLFAVPAIAQEKADSTQISDKTVKTLMAYAWDSVPPQITLRSGKVIKFDRTNRASIELPLDAAKEVIVAAYRSYEAQICGLQPAMVANRDAMMARLLQQNKYSDQQVQYANLLHAFVVAYTSGKVELRYIDPDKKEVKITDIPPEKVVEPKKCSDELRKSVDERIYSYYKSTPGLDVKPADVAEEKK
ncbi:MAG: hypothetical protein APF80_00110 [Alphaproteobacteria bacterium BRH_c36]|nr:MAG: hypothetical protein APF80_00110 [Alphaproteobacteria bacterium BRH_c36]